MTDNPPEAIGRRFEVPTPNCGHRATSFTYATIALVWMCPACATSLGPLYRNTCSNCGKSPPIGTQLADVFRVGRLCPNCKRAYAQRPR